MILEPSEYSGTDFLELIKNKRPDILDRLKQSSVGTSKLVPQRDLLEGTTIIAAVYKDGVVVAGDRRATMWNQIAERRVQKVYEVDNYSAIAIAGVAGLCIEMAKLFQVQVEFYEKIEGIALSLEGKANYLSNMIKSNLAMAMQGLVVIPIFAGYDLKRETGQIYKYDITGGRYEQDDFYAEGSGGKDARSSLKKLYRREMSRDEILKAIAHALWDAADEDSATGGPDLLRNIFPIFKVIDRDGISDVPETEIKSIFTELLEQLRENEMRS